MANTKHKLISLVVVVVVLALVGVWGCAKEEVPTPIAPKVETLTIGAIVPLSGTAASWGVPIADGWRIACADINADGGIKVGDTTYRLEFRAMDSKLDAVEAAACATKLIEAYNVKAMAIGGSGDTLAVQPITEAAKVLIFHQAWSDQTLGPDKKYTFRNQTGGYEPVSGLYKWIHENTPDATIAITNPSYEGGFASEKVVKEFCELYNLKLVFSDFYPVGTTDFTPLLTKMAALNPTYYDTGIGTGDAPLLIKQLHELGWRGRVISVGGLVPADLLEVAGPEACGELHVSFQCLPWGSPKATPEERAYYDKFSREAGTFTMTVVAAYSGAMAYKEAIEGCGSIDPDKVVAWLEANSFDTPFGSLSFPKQAEARYGVNHQIDQPVILSEFVDTKGTYEEWIRSKPVWGLLKK